MTKAEARNQIELALAQLPEDADFDVWTRNGLHREPNPGGVVKTKASYNRTHTLSILVNGGATDSGIPIFPQQRVTFSVPLTPHIQSSGMIPLMQSALSPEQFNEYTRTIGVK